MIFKQKKKNITKIIFWLAGLSEVRWPDLFINLFID